ncbi:MULTISPECIES: hypothetical protein [unclassified Streptomyces]|uniref:hypothetical protein n=1 Tax=unclassified Streptomyces TaxID=2593676 RepID=UPI00344D09E2
MSIPSVVSATGPLGVVASSVASTAYSIVKDFNTKVQLTSETHPTISAVPEELGAAKVLQNLGPQHLDGVFYTHSRFQPIVRRFHHRHPGDVVDVNKSHSIFMVLPWRVSYRAVLLDPSAELVALNKEDRKNAAEMRKIDLPAEKLRLENKQLNFRRMLEEGARADVLESLQNEIQEHEQQIEAYRAYQDSIERRARRAEAVRAMGNDVHMKDFKIDPVEQAHGAKARASTGLKGAGNVFLNAEQAAGRTYVSVHFRWTEENFFGHGHAWEGRIDIGCRQDGSPEVLGGDGKFYERYLETRRG